MNQRALIFGGVIVGAIVIIALGVWVTSLFSNNEGQGAGGQDLFSSLFPFDFGGNGGNTATNNTDGGLGERGGSVPALRQVTQNPVAGAYIATNGILRYVERENGHLFETPLNSMDVTRLSNTTIPGVERAAWLSEATLVLQFFDQDGQLKNYIADFSTTTTDQTLSGRYLGDFAHVLPTASENQMLLVSKGVQGTRIELADKTGTQKSSLFSSPLRSWTVLGSTGALLIETAPSSGLGFVYRVGTNQSLEKIGGGLRGLMALPNAAGTWVAMSVTDAEQTVLIVRDLEGGQVFQSVISTLAEKCVWFRGTEPLLFCGVPPSIPDGAIEDWFMGMTSFNDSAWIIDPVTGVAKIISNLSEAGRPIDIIDPIVSADGKYAVFTNKNDLSLWSLQLEQ